MRYRYPVDSDCASRIPGITAWFVVAITLIACAPDVANRRDVLWDVTATVGGVVGIDIDVARGPAAAADTRDAHVIVDFHPGRQHGVEVAVDDLPDAAAGTENMRQAVGTQQVIAGMGMDNALAGSGFGRHATRTSSICCGVIMDPPG